MFKTPLYPSKVLTLRLTHEIPKNTMNKLLFKNINNFEISNDINNEWTKDSC